MEDQSLAKAREIRSLANNFRDMAERTELPEYRAKLLAAASRLFDAAKALEEELNTPVGA